MALMVCTLSLKAYESFIIIRKVIKLLLLLLLPIHFSGGNSVQM